MQGDMDDNSTRSGSNDRWCHAALGKLLTSKLKQTAPAAPPKPAIGCQINEWRFMHADSVCRGSSGRWYYAAQAASHGQLTQHSSRGEPKSCHRPHKIYNACHYNSDHLVLVMVFKTQLE